MEIRLSKHLSGIQCDEQVIFLSSQIINIGRWKPIIFRLPLRCQEVLKHLFWVPIPEQVLDEVLCWVLEHEYVHFALEWLGLREASRNLDHISSLISPFKWKVGLWQAIKERANGEGEG